MRKPAFKGLTEALSGSSDWAAIDRAWRDSEDLTSSLRAMLPERLAGLVVQVRREDPPKGIRGSQVTVIAQHSAAAAKLRLALSDWPQMLRAQGWGIQHLRVSARRDQEIMPTPPRVSRPTISPQVRQQFAKLAQDMPNPALQGALRRIARRP